MAGRGYELGLRGIMLWRPQESPASMPEAPEVSLETSPAVRNAGIAVIVVTVALYIIFW